MLSGEAGILPWGAPGGSWPISHLPQSGGLERPGLVLSPRQDRTKEGGWQESQVRGCQGKSLEACPEDQQGGTCHLERGLLLPMSYQPFKDPGRSAGATPVHRWVNPCPDCPRALPVDTRLGQGWGWGLLTHKPHPTPGSSP